MCGACAHLRTDELTLPVELRQEEVDPAGLEVRGRGEGPDPAAHCTWPWAGLSWLVRRPRLLRARVQRSLASARGRLPTAT